jgi:hypothetical protein
VKGHLGNKPCVHFVSWRERQVHVLSVSASIGIQVNVKGLPESVIYN